MKLRIAITCLSACLLPAPALRAQDSPRVACYDLTVRIDVPERRVTVGGSFDVNFLGSDSIALVLWRHARIDTMRCDGHEAAYRFDTLAPAPTRFIPDGRALTLYRPAGSPDRCRIGTRYTLDMHEVQGPAKSFNDRWLEIGYYTGWYPVCNGTSADRSHLRIGITDGYTVSGSGIISRTDDGMWEMDQPWEGFDNVILASPVLKTRRMSDNGTTIEFIYTDFPDADAESALNCSYDALKFFRRLYKIAGEENTYIKFSLSASGTSGGYSRKNFITLNSGSFNEYILRNTAHEISHFWWNKAPVESWHDWLNESFAEFSALQYLRHARGEEAYAERVEMYREKTRRIRPIWGIDRADREAHTALYEKGSVLLADLLVRVGEEPFFDFLAAVIRARIADTPAFLDLAETRLGLENRNWIEQRLKQ